MIVSIPRIFEVHVLNGLCYAVEIVYIVWRGPHRSWHDAWFLNVLDRSAESTELSGQHHYWRRASS